MIKIKIHWTYEDDFIILDENMSMEEKKEIIEKVAYKRVIGRARYLRKHKITKGKLIEEQQIIIDAYPDFKYKILGIYLDKVDYYMAQRISELRQKGLLREGPLLTKQIIAYINLHSKNKKASDLAWDLELPLNLVKIVISEAIREEKRKIEKANEATLTIEPVKRHRPKNALDKRIIAQKTYKDGTIYEIELNSDLRKNEANIFRGRLIYQGPDYIVLQHKLGYKESFQKVDFETGEKLIKEVVK